MLCPACPVIGRPMDAAESTRYNRGLPSRLSTDVIDRTAGFPMRPDRDVRLRLRDLNAARWTRQLLPKSARNWPRWMRSLNTISQAMSAASAILRMHLWQGLWSQQG